jgi:hypothetical protein
MLFVHVTAAKDRLQLIWILNGEAHGCFPSNMKEASTRRRRS